MLHAAMKMRIRRRACAGATLTQQHGAPEVQAPATSAAEDRGGAGQRGPTAGRPVLVVHGGPGDGDLIAIVKPTIIMGSLPDNDVVVDGPGVSRRHAEIVGISRDYYLRDLGIANGTFLNRHNIGETEQLLHHGDQINLASSPVFHTFSFGESLALEMILPPSLGPVAGEMTSGVGDLDPAAAEGLYEGTVKLMVAAGTDILLAVHFITELRNHPQVRVLRLENHPHGGVDIWLGLREPVPLAQLLSGMEEVGRVNAPQGPGIPGADQEPVLLVQLVNGSRGH